MNKMWSNLIAPSLFSKSIVYCVFNTNKLIDANLASKVLSNCNLYSFHDKLPIIYANIRV